MLADTLQKVLTSDAMRMVTSRLTGRSFSNRSPARFAGRSMRAHDRAWFKLIRRRFVPREYLSITSHEGVIRTCRILWVWDL
jgi:hypothetical protein